MELALLTFDHDGVERRSRCVNVSDYSAIREAIRRDRMRALPAAPSAEVVAMTVSIPVLSAELSDFMLSVEGQVLLLFRCVQAMDQRFTLEMAEAMVWAEDPFVQRLLVESKVINPTPPTGEPPNSPSSDGSPGK